jgi:SP family general alpha glucoside:H+ symporter-like MFS transporter
MLIPLVAGVSGQKAFDMSVGYLALGFVGTCLSWILISKFGRRRIYNIGLAVLTVIMFIIGILDCSPNYLIRPSIIWAESVLMVCGYSQHKVLHY